MNADETREEFKRINDRLNLHNQTVQQMWAKLRPSVELAEWIQKTYPEILEQYTAVRELEEVSRNRVGVGGFARPEVKGEGDEVRYGNT